MSLQHNQPPPSTPTAEQWQLEYTRMLPVLQQLAALQQSTNPWQLRVLRSSQLDAQRLDAELHTMLHEQFMAVFQLLPQGHVANLEPELNLLLAVLVFWLSVWRGKATPGSELMNLRYRNEHAMERSAAAAAAAVAAAAAAAAGSSSQGLQQQGMPAPPPWLHGGRTGVEGPGLSLPQRLAYALCCVASPYLWLRLHRLAASRGWGQVSGDEAGLRCWRLLRRLDAAHKLGMLVNLWVFLYEGKYRSLVERLIGARLVYRQPSMSRLVSFEYLNRQLVWQELSEFLLFLLPLINVAKVRRTVMRLLPKVPIVAGGSSAGSATHPQADGYPRSSMASSPDPHLAKPQQQQQDSGASASLGPSSSNSGASAVQAGADSSEVSGGSGAQVDIAALLQPLGPCPICGLRDILVPFVAQPCGHIFCYYCLRSHCAADSEFQCPVDGTRVAALHRHARRMPC